MAQGKIKSVFPPSNTNADKHGAGEIDKKDANGNLMGPPFFIFQTPQDCTPPLQVGTHVVFTEGTGQTATNVVIDGDGTGDV